MDKAQALYKFWSLFLPAIDEQSAYDESTLEDLDIEYPYISFEVATDSFDSTVAIGADIWYKSTSWADATEKADEISDYIGLGGVMFPYTGGAIWITRGTPFAQRLPEESGNDSIRRIHININAEYLSA